MSNAIYGKVKTVVELPEIAAKTNPAHKEQIEETDRKIQGFSQEIENANLEVNRLAEELERVGKCIKIARVCICVFFVTLIGGLFAYLVLKNREKKFEEINGHLKRIAPNGVEVVSFMTSQGSSYVVNHQSTTRLKSMHALNPDDVGPKPPSTKTYYLTPEQKRLLQNSGLDGIIVETNEGAIGILSRGVFLKDTLMKPQTEPAIGLHPFELWNDGRTQKQHVGNPIIAMTRRPKPQPQNGEEIFYE